MGFFKDLTRNLQKEPWIPREGEKKAEGPKVDETPFCDPDSEKPCITVCEADLHCRCGCGRVRQRLIEEIARRGLRIRIGNAKTGCSGGCRSGAVLGFPQRGFFYLNVDADAVPRVVEETLVKGRILLDYVSIDKERTYRTDVYYERDTDFIAGIDDSVSMVEVAKSFLDYNRNVSCGKCEPCKQGRGLMYEAMDRLVAGEATEEDFEHIKSICRLILDTPNCGQAETSSRPVLLLTRYFEKEFRARIKPSEKVPSAVVRETIPPEPAIEESREEIGVLQESAATVEAAAPPVVEPLSTEPAVSEPPVADIPPDAETRAEVHEPPLKQVEEPAGEAQMTASPEPPPAIDVPVPSDVPKSESKAPKAPVSKKAEKAETPKPAKKAAAKKTETKKALKGSAKETEEKEKGAGKKKKTGEKASKKK